MKNTPCCRMFTLKEFEGALNEKGITFDQLVEYSQKIYDWWLETDDMTVEELCDDFLHHFGLLEEQLIRDYLDYLQEELSIDDTDFLDWVENVLEDNTDFLKDIPTFQEIDGFILGELESLEVSE